jgi:3-keto-disaccharide hydrolase
LGTLVFSCTQYEWESLFNGENLEGWIVKCVPSDELKKYWSVKEGSIECNSLGDKEHNYVWLATDREFSDFHLKLKFQLFRESGGNSGVQFQSKYDDSDTANFRGWLNGPQVDIHGSEAFRTGLIYDETDGIQRWIHPSLPDWNITPEQAPEEALKTTLLYFEDDPKKWNSMEIICEGMMN